MYKSKTINLRRMSNLQCFVVSSFFTKNLFKSHFQTVQLLKKKYLKFKSFFQMIQLLEKNISNLCQFQTIQLLEKKYFKFKSINFSNGSTSREQVSRVQFVMRSLLSLRWNNISSSLTTLSHRLLPELEYQIY